jgi:predicted aconitase
VGNIPKRGDILAWAESSAVVYANSVIGARTNRTSGVIELFSGIVGKTPKFGFLTDEGRQADWVIEVKTVNKPRPQVLGSAIGMKVLEQVPYIKGLDKFLGTELTLDVKDYLKDMGAATASNGAVGLYHVENLTPEAKDFGTSLIRPNAKTYVIDDSELERVVASYPIMWEDLNGAPEVAFVGCPHCSFTQLQEWTEILEDALKTADKEGVAIATLFSTAPDVLDKFKKTEHYPRLMATGAQLTFICPLMYLSSPLSAAKRVITNSNKLRTYTASRYVDDADLVRAVVEGGLQ